MSLRGLRQLVTVIVLVLGLLGLVAALWSLLGATPFHHAGGVVFLAGGTTVAIFGLVTNGAERRAYGAGPANYLVRAVRVRPDEEIAINFSGALALAGGLAVVLGFVVDAL